MKPRTDGFLADDKIDHSGEIFDYIGELHLILWDFCRYFRPGCEGSLDAWIDQIMPEVRSSAFVDNPSLREIKDKLDELLAILKGNEVWPGLDKRSDNLFALQVTHFAELAESQGKLLARLDAMDAGLHETAMRNHQQVLASMQQISEAYDWDLLSELDTHLKEALELALADVIRDVKHQTRKKARRR